MCAHNLYAIYYSIRIPEGLDVFSFSSHLSNDANIIVVAVGTASKVVPNDSHLLVPMLLCDVLSFNTVWT